MVLCIDAVVLACFPACGQCLLYLGTDSIHSKSRLTALIMVSMPSLYSPHEASYKYLAASVTSPQYPLPFPRVNIFYPRAISFVVLPTTARYVRSDWWRAVSCLVTCALRKHQKSCNWRPTGTVLYPQQKFSVALKIAIVPVASILLRRK